MAEPSPKRSGGLGEAGRYLTLGLELAITMVVAVGGGFLLDRWLETLPWFTLGGAVLGMASMVTQLIRINQEAERRRKASKSSSSPSENGE